MTKKRPITAKKLAELLSQAPEDTTVSINWFGALVVQQWQEDGRWRAVALIDLEKETYEEFKKKGRAYNNIIAGAKPL